MSGVGVEVLLAAQRVAIAEAVRNGTGVRIQNEGAAVNAVLGLVGAWLVDAVQAERERIAAAVEALPRWGGVVAPDHATPNGQWVRLGPVLAVVSRDTRSSSDGN